MIQITSDFSQYADYPLVNSKFAVYICTYVDIELSLIHISEPTRH